MDYYATVDGFAISCGEVLQTDTGEFLRVKVGHEKEEFDYEKMNVEIIDEKNPISNELDCKEDSYYDRYDDRP